MLIISKSLCNGCGSCADVCPFGAVSIENGFPLVNDGCKLCGICVKSCPCQAMDMAEKPVKAGDLKDYRGILVFLEQEGGVLHPVSLEMTGKARELLKTCGGGLYGFMAGDGVGPLADELLRYGFDSIELYEDESMRHFTAGAYTDAFTDCVSRLTPAIVLVGATPPGRCLAPAAATRLRTGVTADCTSLAVDSKGGLVQTRPAFGGNIMAQIITPNTRPQFATVRYKVMDSALPETPHGVVRRHAPPSARRGAGLIVEDVRRPEKSESICDAKVIVAAGRGFSEKKDVDMVKRLAGLLGGTYAVSRPLVEAGWVEQHRQIGLSGRNVKPDFILTLGISGAVQFSSAITGAGKIVAIDKNPEADIFKVAHTGIVGDIYEIVPKLIARLEGGEPAHEAVKLA